VLCKTIEVVKHLNRLAHGLRASANSCTRPAWRRWTHPATLERIAAARDWPRVIDRSIAQPSFTTLIGTWRA
jgi:predicted Zn-dependent protease